jgi:ABC-2 type transport system ATP-binding protein
MAVRRSGRVPNGGPDGLVEGEWSALELIDLTRRFADVVALDAVSFVVPPGQIVGFLGPNGAGKTTAMRIVLGVLEPDRGEVRWRGGPADLSTRRR